MSSQERRRACYSGRVSQPRVCSNVAPSRSKHAPHSAPSVLTAFWERRHQCSMPILRRCPDEASFCPRGCGQPRRRCAASCQSSAHRTGRGTPQAAATANLSVRIPESRTGNASQVPAMQRALRMSYWPSGVCSQGTLSFLWSWLVGPESDKCENAAGVPRHRVLCRPRHAT